MRQFFKYIVSLGLLLCSLSSVAQDSLRVEEKDSTQIELGGIAKTALIDSTAINALDTIQSPNDSVQIEPEINHFAIYISLDYGKLISTAAQFEKKYEFNLGIRFSKRFRVVADVGYGELNPPNAIQNGIYSALGIYYRVGLDAMFEIAPKTFLSFGGMYAFTNFKDQGAVEIQSEVWPSLSQSFVRDNLFANWAELVVTSEAPILNKNEGFFSNLYWGIKFRLRFMVDRPLPENFDVYAIPGYGRTFNNLVPAANLFVSYKF